MTSTNYSEIPSPNTASRPYAQNRNVRILLGICIGMLLMTAVTFRRSNKSATLTTTEAMNVKGAEQQLMMMKNMVNARRQQREQSLKPTIPLPGQVQKLTISLPGQVQKPTVPFPGQVQKPTIPLPVRALDVIPPVHQQQMQRQGMQFFTPRTLPASLSLTPRGMVRTTFMANNQQRPLFSNVHPIGNNPLLTADLVNNQKNIQKLIELTKQESANPFPNQQKVLSANTFAKKQFMHVPAGMLPGQVQA